VGLNPDLYFRQLPLGPMENFVYFIGSKRTKECVVVDPAWDTAALLDAAARDEMKIVGQLVTHYHPDHVGGDFFGFAAPGGVAEMIGHVNAPIHVHKLEAEGLIEITKVSRSDLVLRDAGDSLELGDVKIEFIHTPGHTPGSQCFFVQDRLVSGDTLFVGSCGRVDLPGSDPEQMQETLEKRFLRFEDEVILYPGHDYGPRPQSTFGHERKTNTFLRMRTAEDWLGLK
jgi:glyoxylase-like metal-dependent hydrolase (beta-lactamase superfamily II)